MQAFSRYAPSSSSSPVPVLNSPNLISGYCDSLQRASSVSQIPLINRSRRSSLRYSELLRESDDKIFNSRRSGSTFHCGIRKNCRLFSISCGMDSQSSGEDDGFYMRRAVELARKAIGHTSPNPMVGCVIVKDGEIVGEGVHPKAGQPHAEVFALRDAGASAENATAYVSLEPCNHYGRTPPCSEALIKAKVKKVVVGMVDPNPIVASRGVDKLKDAGIEVIVGVEEDLCKRLNEAYIYQMLKRKPFITLRHTFVASEPAKAYGGVEHLAGSLFPDDDSLLICRYSLSINGCFVNQLGDSATESSGYYSKLLQQYDAVIRSPTLHTQNNQFPASMEFGANQPIQIIIAKDQTSPIGFSDDFTTEASTNIIVFTNKEMPPESKIPHRGIETVVLENIKLEPILEYCESRGICSVLLDLRGNVSDLEDIIEQIIDQNLVQKVVIEMLPVWEVIKKDGYSISLIYHLGKGLRLKNLISTNSGGNVVMEGNF